MPRALFIANVGWFFLSHRLALARAAAAAGYEVHVACGIEADWEAERIEGAGFRFHRLPLERSSKSPWQAWQVFGAIRALATAIDPDVVHLVAIKTILIGGLAVPRRPGRTLIGAFSGLGHVFTDTRPRTRVLRRALRPLFALALRGTECRAIFQNDDDRACFTDAGMIDAGRTVLIRGVGVDLASYVPTALPAGTPQVLLPARMLREKGVMEFGAAARAVRDRGIDAEFVLAGEPDPQNPSSLGELELRDLEKRCGVRWLGHVRDMRAQYAAATIVCLPSYREGMPKTLAEACAAGRPILATDVPGCREAVVPGRNGRLVPARDSEALADALAAMLTNGPELQRMAVESRRVAEERFDERVLIARTLALYRAS